MADTFTSVLNMTLPEIGASDDTWGDKLNDNFDILDALFATTGQGTAIVRDANNDALASGINLTRAAGNARTIKLKSGASLRWDFGADATAEGGANAGSLFKINRYDDAGALLGTPLQIDRASGLVTFASTPKVGANDMLHQGNLSNIPVPIGTPIPWLLDTLPSAGYLWMNGATFVRADFPLLFALIGTKFGVGNGTTTAGLPDWREVGLIGKSTMGGVAARGLITGVALTDTAAAPVGTETKTLVAANLPPYRPAGNVGSVVSGGTKAGTSAATTFRVDGGSVAAPFGPSDIVVTSTFTGTDAPGQISTPVSVVSPSVVCLWAIKAAA